MKLIVSDFWKDVIWFFIWVTAIVLCYLWEVPEREPFVYSSMSDHFQRIFRPVGLIFFSLILGVGWQLMIVDEMKEMIAIKYRIVEESYKVRAEYLTLTWFCIPVWKPVNENCNSYEVQNMFGAKWNSYYTTSVTYRKKQEALDAIEKHKKQVRRNREKFFKRPDKEKSKTTYLK